MAVHRLTKVIQNLRRTSLPNEASVSDGHLLDQFIEHQDEFAFAALVQRHSPMVWGVCRRIVAHHQDAEDAFQATFLVLARKATSIRPREMVANWLYGVAQRTALKAKAMAAKRYTREKQVTTMPEPQAPEQGSWGNVESLIDQELATLPDKYRIAIVLCDLEGKKGRDVARQLKIPEGTLASRLRTARVMLAKRLARQGVVLSGGVLATVLSQNAVSAIAPPLLVTSTIKAATLTAAGKTVAAGIISANAAALLEGVLKAMFLTKLKTVLTTVLMVGMIAFGGGLAAYHHPAHTQSGQTRKAAGEKEAVKIDKEKALSNEKKQQPIDRIQAAYDATKSSLRSGVGTGHLEIYAAPDQSQALTLAIKAKTRVAFIGNKYYVRLDYERHSSNQRSIIICDGKNVYRNDVSDRIIRTGMLGHINEIRKIGEDSSMGPSELAHLNPTRLFDRTVHLPTIVKKYSSSLSFTGDHHTGYVGSYEIGKATCEFHALPEHGFRVSSFKGYLDNKALLISSVCPSWERSGDVWYVKSVEISDTPRGGARSKVKWTYDKFEPNAKVADSHFKFGALEFVEGARLFDHRVKDKAVEYKNVKIRDADAAIVDIAEYVQKLAATEP